MAVWDKKIPWGLVFLLGGAVAQTVSVNYPGPVCAVERSTVTLLCTFTPISSWTLEGRNVPLQIVRVVWCQNHLICQSITPSVYDSESKNNAPRYLYLGDKKGNCTLQISDLQKKDNAVLRFRMEVNHTVGHFTDTSGVTVTVVDKTEMRIISSSDEEVTTAGQTVTLRCTSNCTFHQLRVSWYKDGHALQESGLALHLGPLTAGDSGSYACGLNTNPRMHSPPHTLRVKVAEGGGVLLPLTVGVTLTVLLALSSLALVFFIIRRKSAANQDQGAVEGEVEQKMSRPDVIFSSIQLPEEQDVSYASVQFKHQTQAQTRAVVEADDALVYASVVIRGRGHTSASSCSGASGNFTAPQGKCAAGPHRTGQVHCGPSDCRAAAGFDD
ncbi:uncharacterized protein LOC118284937 isoform X2 [Scophthalmus maximus]|uniref:uncharacterized protein LOC118284937 isoform X2 n=1 Tax=Scophthalmus maximus TaxID=52904 RepID=UPI0015E0C0DA|nr:uncharacterized protein LOC118284937 isoform X2 [Scophthalmus maximus]